MSDLKEIFWSGELSGTRAAAQEIVEFRERFGPLAPEWFRKLLTTRNLIGSRLALSEEDDPSGIGVALEWMSVGDMIEEATRFYPGIAALKMGYVPVGTCLEGSGDPYFLKMSDSPYLTPLVRIPHEAAQGESLDEGEVEVIADCLDEFFELATLET